MMLKAVLPAAALLGLIALSGQAVTQSPEEPGQGAAGWHLVHEGAMAKLAYGLPNSDQLALMITCSPGDRTAVVYGDMHPRAAGLIQASYEPVEVDPLSGGDAFETRIRLSDPELSALADQGRLTVVGETGEAVLPASRAERRMVQGFLSYCAASRV